MRIFNAAPQSCLMTFNRWLMALYTLRSLICLSNSALNVIEHPFDAFWIIRLFHREFQSCSKTSNGISTALCMLRVLVHEPTSALEAIGRFSDNARF